MVGNCICMVQVMSISFIPPKLSRFAGSIFPGAKKTVTVVGWPANKQIVVQTLAEKNQVFLNLNAVVYMYLVLFFSQLPNFV